MRLGGTAVVIFKTSPLLLRNTTSIAICIPNVWIASHGEIKRASPSSITIFPSRPRRRCALVTAIVTTSARTVPRVRFTTRLSPRDISEVIVSIPIAAALLLLVSLAAWTDVRRRRIPNALTAAGLIVGLILNTQLRGIPGLLQSIEGLALAFGVYFLLYLLRAMAAGDVKLMAAIGSFTGPGDWLLILLLVCVAGGAIAIITVAARSRWRTTLRNAAWAVRELVRLRAPGERHPQLDVHSGRGLTLPHAVPIALGTYVFVWSRIAH